MTVTLELLFPHLDELIQTPADVQRLNEAILQLAVQGKLVGQDPGDEPANELLKRIKKEKERLVAAGIIGKSKPVPTIEIDEVPYELPAGWEWVRLIDAGVINPRNDVDDECLVSFIPMTLINDGIGGGHETEQRPWKEIRSGFTHFAEGDVGLAKITPCFQNRKSTVFRNLTNGVGAGTTELHIFRPLGETIIPDYVLAFFKTPNFIANGVAKMTGTAGQQRVPRDYVETALFPLPPLAEQKRIVAKVDELFAQTRALAAKLRRAQEAIVVVNRAVLHHLHHAADNATFQHATQILGDHFDLLYTDPRPVTDLRQTILQLAVQGKLVPQDPHDEPAGVLLKRIAVEKEQLVVEGKIGKERPLPPLGEDEVPFALPMGWEWARLESLTNFIDYRGKTPEKIESGLPLITAKNVRMGYLSREPKEYVDPKIYDSWMTRGIPRKGDVLFTTEAPLGNVALLDTDEPLVLAQRIITLQPYWVNFNSAYLKYALMSAPIRELIESKATGTTAQGIKASRLKLILIPIPPLAEQKRIVAKVDELLARCAALECKLGQAQVAGRQLTAAVLQGVVG